MTGQPRPASCSGNGDCIEVRQELGGWVLLRSTEQPGQLALAVTRAEWDAFAAAVKAGDFDNLEEKP